MTGWIRGEIHEEVDERIGVAYGIKYMGAAACRL